VVIAHGLDGRANGISRKEFDEPDRRRFLPRRHVHDIVKNDTERMEPSCDQDQSRGVKIPRSEGSQDENSGNRRPIEHCDQQEVTNVGGLNPFLRHGLHE